MLRVFLSYPYRPEIEALVRQICCFLIELDIEIINGKGADASIPLRDDIKAKIKKCDVLVSLSFAGIPSRWTEQEIGMASGFNLDVIQLTDGTQPPSGMLAGNYQISLADPWAAAASLAATIRKIKQRRYASCEPTVSANAPLEEYETEGWPREACELLYELRGLFAASHFEECLREARRGHEKFPTCWRFHICQSAALTHLNKLSQADQLLDKVIQDFAGEPRALSYALDNRAWILSRQPGATTNKKLRTRVSLLRDALKSEPRVETYIELIYCLLKLNQVDKAEYEFRELTHRYPMYLGVFRERVRLNGKEYIQAIAKSDLICGLLFPLEEAA